jgi:hypothetical protein
LRFSLLERGLSRALIHGHLERVGYCSMKTESILNFEEWIRIINWRSANLWKAEIFISIRSKVMSKILMVFDRVFFNFTLRTMFSKISWLMFSTPVFDAKLHSASNNDDFKQNMWQKYGSVSPNTMFSTFSC